MLKCSLSEHVDAETMRPYRIMLESMRERFGKMYEKAGQDKTLRTDVPEEEMFSTSLHLMMAAITRYAIGLVYKPRSGFDGQMELETMKRILLKEYGV